MRSRGCWHNPIHGTCPGAPMSVATKAIRIDGSRACRGSSWRGCSAAILRSTARNRSHRRRDVPPSGSVDTSGTSGESRPARAASDWHRLTVCKAGVHMLRKRWTPMVTIVAVALAIPGVGSASAGTVRADEFEKKTWITDATEMPIAAAIQTTANDTIATVSTIPGSSLYAVGTPASWKRAGAHGAAGHGQRVAPDRVGRGGVYRSRVRRDVRSPSLTAGAESRRV